MTNPLSVLAGTLISSSPYFDRAFAARLRHPELEGPARRQQHRQGGPFFIDTTGLDFNTQPPTRDPANPNYPRATELADGTLPPAGAEGNFIIGPTHNPAPETLPKEGVPQGTVESFTLSSKDSTIYNPGLIRDDVAGCGNSSIMSTTTVPDNKSNMIVTTSHPGTWTRTIDVYVPAEYVARHRDAVHRGRRRRLDRVEGSEHHARQPDRRSAACRR